MMEQMLLGDGDLGMDAYGNMDQPRSDPSNLIVNYLPPSFSQEDLRRLFEPFGKIEKCKILVDRKGRSATGSTFLTLS